MRNLISEEVLRNFIISELDGDRAFFDRLLSYLTKHLAEFGSVNKESEKAKLLAHKIRSGCNSFGAFELAGILEKFEYDKSAKGNSDSFEKAVLLIHPTLKTILEVADVTFGEIKKSG